MLFYSGFTRSLGEVDEGSTIMDYLPAERARGITITSAAITFTWTPSASGTGAPPQEHTFNLIDTPGHADFTFEVARSLRILDGCITILDGVAGVEAQTETVWRQAHAHRLPRIAFVNKLDRVGASFEGTVRDIASKLQAWPAVLQLPFYEQNGMGGEKVLRGIVDVISQRVFVYAAGGDGRTLEVKDYDWLASTDAELHAKAGRAREALIELLTAHDDVLVEQYLEHGDGTPLPADLLHASLRRLTLSGSGHVVPVLCGASFRNIGVQPLLDAVTLYLPSPLDRPPVAVTVAGERSVLDPATAVTCALAFKVVHDAKRGAMVFVRVYSGTLHRGAALWNTALREREKASRLLRMYANEAVDISSLSTGSIGVVLGLKHARTGDTLVTELTHAEVKAEAKRLGQRPHHSKNHSPHSTLQLAPIPPPPPVFFAALEPYSLSAEKQLKDSLELLLREDPSLAITIDEESGQTLLSGMGELHLEIARDRLVGDLKAQASMGRILIAYRETPAGESAAVRKEWEREVAGKAGHAAVTAHVAPLETSFFEAAPQEERGKEEGKEVESTTNVEGNRVVVKIKPSDSASTSPDHELTPPLVSGALAALSRGPLLAQPLHAALVTLTLDPDTDLFGTLSSAAALSSVARAATAAAIADAGTIPMEPVMAVSIGTPEADMGKVVADITGARGGHIVALDDDEEDEEGQQREDTPEVQLGAVYIPGGSVGGLGAVQGGQRARIVRARVPLKEMVGYLKHLRSVTGGRGGFVMNLHGWEKVVGPRRDEVEREMRGS